MPPGWFGMIDREFWRGRKVLLTGQTGFKGSWMVLLLHRLGSVVSGYALDPPTAPSLFEEAHLSELVEDNRGDIRNKQRVESLLSEFAPEIVIHMAAQPLVRESYRNPIETFDVNVMGTANVIEACKNSQSVKSVVVVTTDKCYENKEWVWPYRETDPLGGFDPYSASKACAEIVTASYLRSFYTSKGIATARAGNVIGGGDWACDRLVPDIIRSLEAGENLVVRNSGAIRPWQHVLDPLLGYLCLAEKLYDDPDKFSGAWNFGPDLSDIRSVADVISDFERLFSQFSWALGCADDNPHEATTLKLDISKSIAMLDWRPALGFDESVLRTGGWYADWRRGRCPRTISVRDIDEVLKKVGIEVEE